MRERPNPNPNPKSQATCEVILVRQSRVCSRSKYYSHVRHCSEATTQSFSWHPEPRNSSLVETKQILSSAPLLILVLVFTFSMVKIPIKYFYPSLAWNYPRWLSRYGAVVRALASHQCVPGLIPGPGVGWVCCLFSPLLKYNMSKFLFETILECTSISERGLVNSVEKQITFFYNCRCLVFVSW